MVPHGRQMQKVMQAAPDRGIADAPAIRGIVERINEVRIGVSDARIGWNLLGYKLPERALIGILVLRPQIGSKRQIITHIGVPTDVDGQSQKSNSDQSHDREPFLRELEDSNLQENSTDGERGQPDRDAREDRDVGFEHVMEGCGD